MTAKRWLITGVSGGLGRALAEAALARGDRVAGTVRTVDAGAGFERLAPGRAFAIQADLLDADRVACVVDEGAARLGGLDILVNNAGHALAGALEEISAEEATSLFAINFMAPLRLCQAALPLLRDDGGGRILNISSMAALESYRGLGLYCATKAALSAMSEALAIEAARFAIHVTAVESEGLRTNFAGSSLQQATGRLDDYAEMRIEMAAAFARSDGQQRNDPVRAAQALLALADLRDPPRHFALGGSAVDRIETILASRLEEYRRHAALGRDILVRQRSDA